MFRIRHSHEKKSSTNKLLASTTALLMTYLPVVDQLSWRAASRDNRDAAQRAQRGPYRSQAAFAMAATGLFYTRIEMLMERSWQYYTRILQVEGMKPAMLYRLNERSRKNARYTQKLLHFKNGEDIEQQERIYRPPPDDHFWAYNLVWMLAQIHKGRSFMILSDITVDNMKSISKHGRTSAFAKEIVAALLAGYTTEQGPDDNIILVAPDLSHALKVNIADLQAERKVIEEKYKALMPMQKLDQFQQYSRTNKPVLSLRKKR